MESVYNWADVNNMLLNPNKFDYLSFASRNIFFHPMLIVAYVNPNLSVINQHDNIKDLGILMSSDCGFEKHILSVSSKCSSLSGWILRSLASRDTFTKLTLYKSLILSRLEYGSQLWSPYKVRDNNLLRVSSEIIYQAHLKYE